jgi:hypothetical protein
VFERVFILIGLLMLASSIQAQELVADPLRPETHVPPLAQGASGFSAAGLPRLSMIVRNLSQHYAMLDGRPCLVGDMCAGFRVLAIHPSSVLLQRDKDPPFEVGLFSAAVVKKPLISPIQAKPHP